MRKWLAIPLVLLITLTMIIGSCGTAEETTKTSTPTQTTTSKPAPSATTATPSTTGPTTPTKVIPTGTITDAIQDFGYETFDPNVLGATGWVFLLCDTLVRTKEDMSFEGGVVDSWSMSDNGCVWTFKVHKGIEFTNGDKLTAADVKYSVDRFGQLDSGSPWSQYISVKGSKLSTRVVDDYTFEYSTKWPEATLLACFAATPIFDKALAEKMGPDYFKAPIGSGAWKLVELVSKTSVKFEANANYWRTNEVPAYQYYVELCVPELATRISMLKTGQIDILFVDDYTRLKELADLGFSTAISGIAGTDSFAFQGSWLPEAGPVYDIRIRQAMSYALNRQEICDTWYQGYAVPGGQFFMVKGIFGWDDALSADPYDVAKAKQLIADAGYPANFANPKITVYTDAINQDRLLLYISYWQAVGLQVELKVVDLTVYYGYLFHNFDGGRIKATDTNLGWIWFWKSWSYPNSIYHSANMYTSVGVHSTTNDPKADEMYAAVTHQKDYSVAAEKMKAFQIYVKSLYTNIGVCAYDPYYLYNPDTIGAWNGRNWDGYGASISGIQHPTK